MNLIELQRALGQLRLGGMAAVLETRLRQAQAEAMAPINSVKAVTLISRPPRPDPRRLQWKALYNGESVGVTRAIPFATTFIDLPTTAERNALAMLANSSRLSLSPSSARIRCADSVAIFCPI